MQVVEWLVVGLVLALTAVLMVCIAGLSAAFRADPTDVVLVRGRLRRTAVLMVVWQVSLAFFLALRGDWSGAWPLLTVGPLVTAGALFAWPPPRPGTSPRRD